MYQSIRQYIRYKWKRLIVVAAIIGPGLITAFADNDASGVSAYSVAAAQFGYPMLIITIPMTLLLAITQEIGARIALVTEKGLGDLIRERYGVRVAIFIFTILFIANMAVIIMDVSAMKDALRLFGLSPYLFIPILGILFAYIVWGSYRSAERLFLVMILFYLVYVFSAILAKPDWSVAISSLFIPKGTMTPKFIYTAIAVVGTTITAWGQFFISSSAKDKHLTTEHIKYNRVEVYTGAFLTDLFSFFMMVAVIATLFVHRIPIEDAAGASIAIRPFAGHLAGILFGAGLLVAGILGCLIIPLSTAYAFSEFFGYSGSLDESFHKSRLMYMTFLIQLIIAGIIVLSPQISLFTITIVGNFINGAILPIIFFFLYRLVNNERIMGKYKNTAWQNWLLIGGAVFITIASIFGVIGQLARW